MQNFTELETNIKSIIDDLKGLCSTNGLSNTASEEIIVTSVFLYKFLNDKFIANLHKFAKDIDISYDELMENKDEYMDAFYDTYPQDVALAYEDTIDYLVNFVSDDDFYKKFDEALVRISSYPQNDAFNIDTAEGTKKPLFTPLSDYVTEPSKRNSFARSIFSYITRDRFDFGITTESNYDFFSTIFEYLISDYNTASGKYAAVICLGAVIKGSTSHYDQVCAEVSKGVATVGLNTGVPTLFGVLTTDNIEQAIERAGTKAGNKGYDVACSAIEMVNLMKEL